MSGKKIKNKDGSPLLVELTSLTRTTTSQIQISGMTCGSCVSSVERRVKKINGVVSVSVALLQELAEITYDANKCDNSTIIKAIDEIGFTATLKTNLNTKAPKRNTQVCHLRINGMVCNACSNGITQELENTDGVHSVQISLLRGEAEIEYSAQVIQLEDLVQKIEDIGFGANLIHASKLDQIILSIPSLTTAADGVCLEESLMKASGVDDVSISLALSEVHITFNPDIIGPRDLVFLIKTQGFSSQLVDSGSGIDPIQQETQHWKRLFQLSLIFTLPVAIMSMLLPRVPFIKDEIKTEVLGVPFDVLFKWVMTTPVQFIIGWRFQAGAFKALRHGSANMDVLVALGTDASYIYSMIAVLTHFFQGHHQDQYTPTDFFETAALLITFILLGKYLESAAKSRTSDAISKLIQLIPDTATLVNLGKANEVIHEEEIEVSLVQKGDNLKIYAGARIPADGIVIMGQSHVNESMITGESTPVPKTKDSLVIGGTVNTGGVLIIKAQRVGSDTALSQIVRLVEQAQLSKAPIQYIADRISLFFVPIVIVLAIITWIVWYISGVAGGYPADWLPQGHNYFLFSLLFGIAVLVIACPCALGLATPTAVMVGTGVGAQLGILIKGGDALEKAYNVDTVIFDKTGTLTLGKPSVVTTKLLLNNIKLEELYSILASAEQESDHPLSNAIMNEAEIIHQMEGKNGEDEGNRNWIRAARQTELRPGKGIVCWTEVNRDLATRIGCMFLGPSSSSSSLSSSLLCEVKALVGNKQHMEEEKVHISAEIEEYSRKEQTFGNTVVFAAVESTLLGAISICDPPKPEAAAVITALEEKNIDCYMVTGDNWTTARSISQTLGIKNVLAEVLPAWKAKKVEELQKAGHVVAMVGDGINDAPALVAADVGMAIGSGTDTAIEAADYVLMHDNLEDVVTAIDLSNKTFSRIKMNYFWAFAYNTLMIPVAAGILYPFFRLQMPPWIAGGAMALSSVSVVISSLLLRRYEKPNVFHLYSI